MAKNRIYFRFSSEKEYMWTDFPNDSISTLLLKQIIKTQHMGSYNPSREDLFSLKIQDNENNKVYEDSDYLKPMTRIVIYRMPSIVPIQNNVIDHNDDPNIQKEPTKPLIPVDPEMTKFGINSNHKLYKYLKNSKIVMIKCSIDQNIDISQRENVWATTQYSQNKLQSLFKSCENLLLILVGNRMLQGVARVKAMDPVNKVVNWILDGKNIKLGATFPIEWIIKCNENTQIFRNEKKSNGELVMKSRDAEEIPRESGLKIITHCFGKGDFLPEAFQSTKFSKILLQSNENSEVVEEKMNNLFFDQLSKAGQPEVLEPVEEIKKFNDQTIQKSHENSLIPPPNNPLVPQARLPGIYPRYFPSQVVYPPNSHFIPGGGNQKYFPFPFSHPYFPGGLMPPLPPPSSNAHEKKRSHSRNSSKKSYGNHRERKHNSRHRSRAKRKNSSSSDSSR